jgi:hypothetical protein
MDGHSLWQFQKKSQTSMDMTHCVHYFHQVINRNSYDTKICGKAKRLVLLTRENAILVELTRYLSYYISILQMGRAWTFAKVWQYFHKVWIMQGPTSLAYIIHIFLYHATHRSFVSWPQPNNTTLVIKHSKEGFSLCIWTHIPTWKISSSIEEWAFHLPITCKTLAIWILKKSFWALL